jgi:hypothetical protein
LQIKPDYDVRGQAYGGEKVTFQVQGLDFLVLDGFLAGMALKIAEKRRKSYCCRRLCRLL